MNRKINAIIILLNLFIISLFLLFIAPDIPAEIEIYTNPSYPQVEIKGIWGGRTAKVGTGDTGIVNFNCSVEVTFPQGYYNPASTINVSLKTEDEWNTSNVEQPFIIFSEAGVKTFIITAKAPLKTSCYDDYVINFTGDWQMEPAGFYGKVENPLRIKARIKIAQFYNFSVSSKKTYLEAKPGDIFQYNFNIKNEGNGQDTFTIEFVNDDELERKGNHFSFTQSNLELNSNESETIGVHVRLVEDIRVLGEYKIKIRVQSDRGMKDGVEPQTITFRLSVPNETIIYTSEFIHTTSLIIICVILISIFALWRRRRMRKILKA